MIVPASMVRVTPAFIVTSQVNTYGLWFADQVVFSEIVPQNSVGPLENRLVKVPVLFSVCGSIPWVPSSLIEAILITEAVPSGMGSFTSTAKITSPFAPEANSERV